jgi:thymidylate synthase (FAD)
MGECGLAPSNLLVNSMSDQANISEPTPSRNVLALDAILGKAFRVLDDGFVRVTDYMGSDASIVQAARVSYGAGTKRVQEDRGLIRYLLRHRHTTPFEMCELKLHVRVPMDCWRQWIRHRTASVNEYSTRYSVAIDAMQQTPEDGWRSQSVANRQGSSAPLPPDVGKSLSIRERELQAMSRAIYEERLTAGVAREQARKDLPLSTYTEAYWKIDLHNLFHFLRLRMDAHAQHEIREYATTIGNEIVARWCPVAWEAFQEYELTALHLSGMESTVVRFLAHGQIAEATRYLMDRGLLATSGPHPASRERNELADKLTSLGFTPFWLTPPK